MSKLKIILAVVGVIILIAGIIVGVFLVQRQQELRKKAAPATSISFTPTQKVVQAGETFTISVQVNTGQNIISAAELHIVYNPQLVHAERITAGTFLPIVLVPGTTNNTLGKTSITLGSQATEPKQGSGTLATISFTAQSSGTASLRFASETQVRGPDKTENVLASTNTASVIIGASNTAQAAAPTNTPIASPSTRPSVNPTPSPSPRPTTSPKPTATAKPRTSPAATPTATAIATAQLPQAGTALPTIVITMVGISLLIFGTILAF